MLANLVLAMRWHPLQPFNVFLYSDGNSNLFIITQTPLVLMYGVGLAELATYLLLSSIFLDNIRRDSVKKNDDAPRGHEDWVHYFSSLAADYLTVVLPILMIFTASTLFTAFSYAYMMKLLNSQNQ
jgi:hypothetical protein